MSGGPIAPGSLVVGRAGFGAPASAPHAFPGPGGCGVRWGLALTGSCLRFAARFAPEGGRPRSAPGRVGEFVEGLWKSDVAELFLADPADGRYLEFNLSPAGEWWACAFSAPRQRDPAIVLPPVSAHGGETPELWIDKRGLPFNLRSATANVTAIVEGHHFSAVLLNPPQPDFHRPAEFHAIEIAPARP